MSKAEWKPVVVDQEQIDKLEAEFQEKRAQVKQKIYTSVTEERLRTNKIIAHQKIKAPVAKVFQTVIQRSCKDLHLSLNYQDLKPDTFYLTSGKTNKIPFKITEFQENKVMTIEYYANNQQFIKTLCFFPNKKDTNTKIVYTDLAVGLTSVLGWYEKHIRGVYIKRQVIAFKVQILNALLDLNLIAPNKKTKVEKQIQQMLNDAQKAF